MTETSTISPGSTSTDDGAGMLPMQPDSDGTDGGNRRRLLILGAVAGVIVLAAVAYLLLHKGSSSSPSATVVPHGTVASAPATKPSAATTTHKTTTTKSLPKNAKHQLARDPFIPLITAPVSTSGGAVSSTTVPAGSSPSTAPSTGASSPSPNPSSSGKTSGKTTGGPLWIQLTGTTASTATFKVGYSHHKFRRFTVQAPKASSDQGTVFAKIFALISVQNGEATVQIGDAAPFILTTGVAHVA
jgi:hypothetical protein